MQFLTLSNEVLHQRARDGVRGIDREWSRWRCHIESAPFIAKDVKDITSPDIREWLRLMAQKPALGPGEPRKLSRQTVNRCQSLVSAIFIEAVERELIAVNPCMGVKPKKRVDESDTKEKWAYLVAEEQRTIAACGAIPREDRLAILFAIATGLRQGEQRHLRLDDIDLTTTPPCVHVVLAGHTKDGRGLPPKSGKPRMIRLLKDGEAVAREWLEMLPTFAPHNPHRLVFPTASGTYRQQGKMLGRSDTLKRRLAAAGVTRRVRWHDLRHTCATNLLEIHGWRLELVQKVMGHSSITITQRYAHLTEDAIADAVLKSNEAMVLSAPKVMTLPEPPPGLFERVMGRFLGRVEVARV
jgi:site-specific recombinase XerD